MRAAAFTIAATQAADPRLGAGWQQNYMGGLVLGLGTQVGKREQPLVVLTIGSSSGHWIWRTVAIAIFIDTREQSPI